MCNIDKELVMRAAAHFATYAAEREPPKVEPFLARMIEQAIRSKIPAAPPKPILDVVPPTVKPIGDMKTAMRIAREMIAATRLPGSPPSDKLCKVLVALQAEPDRLFNAAELATIGGYPNPSKTGAFHRAIEFLIEPGFAEKPEKGRYKLGPKGTATS